MGHNGNSYYIGIDLNDSYAMVSFFQQNMKEPETVSTVAGSASNPAASVSTALRQTKLKIS